MKTEFVKVKRKETSLKIQASEINSIRVKDIERNAVRVYKDNKIGISGAIGDSNLEALKEQAVNNLSSNIPYPYELEKNKKDHRSYIEKEYSEKELLELTETILTEFKKEHNDFIYSESVKSISKDISMTNTDGLDLRYQDSFLDFGIIVKAKSSPNLFDTFVGWIGRNFDLDKFISFSKSLLTAERTKVELPEMERIPVFNLGMGTVGNFLSRQLSGEVYANNASLFDKKIGKKIFHEKFNLLQDKDPVTTYENFFDQEGATNEGDQLPLIENGILKRVFTDKKNAEKYNLEHTGAASGGYDDIPTLGGVNLSVKVDAEDIKKTLNGEMAIFVVVASGGEVNADGNYASPVQCAYLFDGEKLIGKLPDFAINNSVFKMFGEDYIGTFKSNDLYFGEHMVLTGTYMNISK